VYILGKRKTDNLWKVRAAEREELELKEENPDSNAYAPYSRLRQLFHGGVFTSDTKTRLHMLLLAS
jgi:hypothetical protein